MSKPLFILLLLVALLTVGVTVQPDAPRFGEESFAPSLELRADIESFKRDVVAIIHRIEYAPPAIRSLLNDFQQDLKALKADAAADVHTATHRFASLVKTDL